MYKLNKYKYAKGFHLYNENFSYLNENNEQYVNNFLLDIQVLHNGYFLSEKFFFYNNSINNQLYDIKTGEKKDIGFLIPQLFYSQNKYICLKYNDNYTKKDLILYDFDNNLTKIIIKNFDLGIKLLKGNSLIVNNGWQNIKSLSILTGEYEWEIDLGVQGFKVGGIVGVEDKNLIIICENEQNQQILLSLDVATGKELWTKNMQVSYSGFAFSEDKTSIINLHAGGLWLNGVQVVRGSNIFREINTIDGSARREGILWQLDEAGLGVKNYTLHKGFIYFTAVYQSFGATVIGLLDYETLSLLWWEEVQMQEADGFGNFFLNQPLQVSDNKIYVLDKTHVLHIYERDESVPFVKPTESGLVAFEDLPTEPETNDLPTTESTNSNDFSGGYELPF